MDEESKAAPIEPPIDETTKKTVQKIPLLTTRAGPRDGDKWIERLKEEYQALIKVFIDQTTHVTTINSMCIVC